LVGMTEKAPSDTEKNKLDDSSVDDLQSGVASLKIEEKQEAKKENEVPAGPKLEDFVKDLKEKKNLKILL